ncbi:MAG: IS481 family transposase, partial [Hyphomonadaceae bacterium]|nr:IS481 family transposase [Hyphomonadaceae bacterium]
MALRRMLLISLDDLVVCRAGVPEPKRLSLRREPVLANGFGVGNLRELKANSPRPGHSGFEAYQPEYLHMDVKYLPQMADQDRRRHLFVAIDRATRRVFIRVFNAKTAA